MEGRETDLLQKTVLAFSEQLASGVAIDYQFVCKCALNLAVEVNSEKISGSEKKVFVLRILKAAAKEAFVKVSESVSASASVEGGPSAEVIDDWVSSVLPVTLDLVIGAARGKLSELSPAAVVEIVETAVISSGCAPACMPDFLSFVRRIVQRAGPLQAPVTVSATAAQPESAVPSGDKKQPDTLSKEPQKEQAILPGEELSQKSEAPPVAQSPGDESVQSA
jgi:hypothetical protein